ncbi:MAG: arylsulfatase [Pirellulales bacterium]|nr:arylsulfatase [Pirellulales bacterium]
MMHLELSLAGMVMRRMAIACARLGVAGMWLASLPAVAASLAPARPNIVMILADDLGYGDLHCYNPDRGKIPTPHLDRLAASGMRFTDAHSSSACCSPSRYALLTGRYHWRTRLQAGICELWERPLIARERLTIGKLAQQHGYRTACIGKWHLGEDWGIADDQARFFRREGSEPPPLTPERLSAWRAVFGRPLRDGPTTRGFDEYFGTIVPNWPPYAFVEGDRVQGLPSTYLPADLVGHHLASFNGPALPGWQLAGVLPALRDRAIDFIRRQAQPQQPFLLYLPLTTPHTPLAVNPPWSGRSGLGLPVADLIMETDDVVGQVLAALDEHGASENTLVLFTSDNGFAAYVGAAQLEAQGHYPSGPLRGYKRDAYEGGHRVPFVVRWPGHVAPGSICDQLVHQADWMATLAEILGAKLPDDAAEDSFSMLPLFAAVRGAVREHAVSCASDGTMSVRQGTWKLIQASEPELYDLATDLGEQHNLAAAQPERVVELQALLEGLILQGRSTPGPRQTNDVEVRRFPRQTAKNKKSG